MYIIAIAWGFVVVLMAASEAMTSSLVGGLLTLLFYGALPMAVFFYLAGTPARGRRRARRADADPGMPDGIDAQADPPAQSPTSATTPANRPVVPSRRNE